MRIPVVLATLALVAGCDRGHPRDEAPAPPPRASAPVVAGCSLAALPIRIPAPARLVAIGDLHGDLGAARGALRAAGAIDDQDHWSGGALVVVQTGDVLDRGDDERALLDLIARLEGEAQAAGGAYVMLLGNHELMNAAGDFRYVTPAGLHAFDDVPGPAPAGGSDERARRAAALGPGGRYGRWLARHAVIAIVGDAVFSHAGVVGDWAGRVAEINQSARCWLDGQASQPPAALTSDDSPVWTRAVGGPAPDCAGVTTALAALGARRMVVGHTVQERGITSACDGALWRIDVGLARRYGGPIEILELTLGAAPRVVAGAPR